MFKEERKMERMMEGMTGRKMERKEGKRKRNGEQH